MPLTFVLIASPLLRAASWGPVARELRAAGHLTHAPELDDDGDGSSAPFWRQHAQSAVQSMTDPGEPFVLVGHSGAGPLLPAIAEAFGRPPLGYLFVDAGIPRDGASRIDLFGEELGADAGAALRRHLEGDGLYPVWERDALAAAIGEVAVLDSVVRMARPRGLAYWDEPLPVFDGWPDAPCAYLRLSEGYEYCAGVARERQWPVRSLRGGHFDLMTKPQLVATEMLELLAEMANS
jgi:hypothetical protein